MPMAVKICGLADERAIKAVIDAGADYAGFVHFSASPRHVSFERAAKLKSLLPASIRSVCVTVDPDDALLAQMQSVLKPDYVQLHGKETPERLRTIRKKFPALKIIKAIAIRSGDDVALAAGYVSLNPLPTCGGGLGRGGILEKDSFEEAPSPRPSPTRGEGEEGADMLMFDAKPPVNMLPGGNGLAFDWALLKNRQFQKPWFLSGGLNAENIAEAIRISGATMVDVSSGVESAPGVKDAGLIKAFVKAAKHETTT